MSALRNTNYEYDSLYFGGQDERTNVSREVRRRENRRNVVAKGNVRYINAEPAQQTRRQSYTPQMPAREQEKRRAAQTRGTYQSAAAPAKEQYYRPVRRSREETVEIPMQDAKTVARARRAAVKNILTVLVVFCLLAAVVTRYAVISANNVENYELAGNITKMEDSIKDLTLQLSMQDDLEMVQEVAQSRMSMGFPQTSQTRYIEYTPKAAVQTSVGYEEPEGVIHTVSRWFETVKGWFE